jgi:hypothetical protein
MTTARRKRVPLFRNLIVVGLVLPLVLTATRTSAAILHFDIARATLTASGVLVEGTIVCDDEERARINLSVTRSVSDFGDDALARGETSFGCTGDRQQWQVLAEIKYGFTSCEGLPIEVHYRVTTVADRVPTDEISGVDFDVPLFCASP